MEHLRKFLRLSTAERLLLIKTALLLEAIKLGMWLLPFRTLRRLLTRMAEAAPVRLRHADHPSDDRIAWAVETASRHTSRLKTCLTQALAAQVLLARRGHPALLHIGVVKGEREQFQAHAWVESEGKVVIGGLELGRYTTLAVLEVAESKGSRNSEALAEIQ
jgi:Transglutaminase-like superfamily